MSAYLGKPQGALRARLDAFVGETDVETSRDNKVSFVVQQEDRAPSTFLFLERPMRPGRKGELAIVASLRRRTIAPKTENGIFAGFISCSSFWP
jgi:hypothetical protein